MSENCPFTDKNWADFEYCMESGDPLKDFGLMEDELAQCLDWFRQHHAALRSRHEALARAARTAVWEMVRDRESGDCGFYDPTEGETGLRKALSGEAPQISQATAKKLLLCCQGVLDAYKEIGGGDDLVTIKATISAADRELKP